MDIVRQECNHIPRWEMRCYYDGCVVNTIHKKIHRVSFFMFHIVVLYNVHCCIFWGNERWSFFMSKDVRGQWEMKKKTNYIPALSWYDFFFLFFFKSPTFECQINLKKKSQQIMFKNGFQWYPNTFFIRNCNQILNSISNYTTTMKVYCVVVKFECPIIQTITKSFLIYMCDEMLPSIRLEVQVEI